MIGRIHQLDIAQRRPSGIRWRLFGHRVGVPPTAGRHSPGAIILVNRGDDDVWGRSTRPSTHPNNVTLTVSRPLPTRLTRVCFLSKQMFAPTEPGTAKVGRYRSILPLGQGGMAEVLLAVGRGPGGFNKLVVLKSMRTELTSDPELRQMFLAEARLSARLNHANVVQVYEVLDQEQPCIVMEYLDGQAMNEVHKAAGDAFVMEMQLRVISEVLTGLHYSHELCDYDASPLNLVHRDVSPQNVFITYDGQVKVLDFGIAKVESAPGQTKTGIIKGKLGYMPPEQLLGERLDRRADIYAVGCMLWQAAAGQKLWLGRSEGDIMRGLVEGAIPAPSTQRPVDARLEAMVMKALSPEPDDRFPTALHFQAELDDFLSERSSVRPLRDIGAFVAELFAEQREARSKSIHAALSAPASMPPPAGEYTDSGHTGGQGAASNTASRRLADQSAESRGSRRLVAGAFTAVLIASAAGYVLLRNDRAGSAAPSVTAAPAHSIQLNLSVLPRDVRITVDGVAVEKNPTTLKVLADGEMHEIHAERDGYYPLKKQVRFERDLSFETVLREQPSAAPVASAQPSAEPATSSEPTPHVYRGPARRWGGKPNVATPAPASDNVADLPSHGSTKSCDPPFYLEDGIKVYKPGCL